MSAELENIKAEVARWSNEGKSAGELVDYLGARFPEVQVYRQNDDLIIRGRTRFLVVRRAGPDSFHVAENVAVPSTDLVDFGGGATRTVDELVDEIANFAR